MRYSIIHFLQFIILINFTIVACNGNNKATNQDSTAIQMGITQQPLSTSINSFDSDTMVVYRKAAVFYEPDSAQIEKQKKMIGENNFYTSVEDYAFYLNAAHDYLDSARILMLYARGKKVIAFVGNNQTERFIRLDTSQELWGIYFFEPAKAPKQIHMTEIEEEYKGYFK